MKRAPVFYLTTLATIALAGCGEGVEPQSEPLLVSALIQAPSSGLEVDDTETLSFYGTYSPATGEPSVTGLIWTSSLTGDLHVAGGAAVPGESRFESLLPAGEHEIRFTVTFSDGQSATDAVQLSVAASGTAPEVSVLWPGPEDQLAEQHQAVLQGQVSSEEHEAFALVASWTVVTPEGDSTSLTSEPVDADGTTSVEWTPTLGGTHTIRLQVEDPDGLTAHASVAVQVAELSEIDNDGDGFTADVDCDDTDPTIHPGAPDAPDLDYIDSNCDGIDGDIGRSVFVDQLDGNDFASGLEPGAPVSSLERAVTIAEQEGREWVLLRVASTSPYRLEALDVPVSLAGGYEAGFQERGAERTLVSPLEARHGLVLWRLDEPVRLQHLRVEAGGPRGGDSPHNIALHVFESEEVRLESMFIQTFEAERGRSAEPPDKARQGEPGSDGGSIHRACGGSFPDCARLAHAVEPGNYCGGSAAHDYEPGGRGGDGGYLGWGVEPTRGAAGADAPGPLGGEGGAGGYGWRSAHGPYGEFAEPGQPGAVGQDRHPRFEAGEPSELMGTLELSPLGPGDLGYIPPVGSVGPEGGPGGGGGGGGGGVTGLIPECTDRQAPGGGGGGGGGGGEAGAGGLPGGGGGASIGLIVTDSAVSLAGTEIRVGPAGEGGDGSVGGEGGDGGPGGAGGTSNGEPHYHPDLSDGAPGGVGGRGGRGGPGGAGSGGPALGVWCRGEVSIGGREDLSFVLPSEAAMGGRIGDHLAFGPPGLLETMYDCP